jgi:hypothetical protein
MKGKEGLNHKKSLMDIDTYQLSTKVAASFTAVELKQTVD